MLDRFKTALEIAVLLMTLYVMLHGIM